MIYLSRTLKTVFFKECLNNIDNNKKLEKNK